MSQQGYAENYDPFKGETGLKDDFDGLVVNAWFNKDPEVGGGNLHLYLEVEPDDGDDNQELRYGCGQEWSSFDGGESAEHPKDKMDAVPPKPKGFNNRTAIFELIQAAFNCGAEEELRARSDQQFNGLGPRFAAIWKGMKFHWEVKEETYNIKDRKTGEDKEIKSTRTLPTAFLGVDTNVPGGTVVASSTSTPAQAAPPSATTAASDTAPVAPSAPAPSPAPSPEAAPAVPTEPVAAPASTNGDAGSVFGFPAETVAKLRLLANNNDFANFVNSAMSLDNGALLANNEFIAALGDEGLYESLKG